MLTLASPPTLRQLEAVFSSRPLAPLDPVPLRGQASLRRDRLFHSSTWVKGLQFPGLVFSSAHFARHLASSPLVILACVWAARAFGFRFACLGTAVEHMVPVGRGQRELVVGDRQTGKTAIGLDTTLNQSGLGVLCFLAAVGQKATSTFKTCLALASHGAFWYASVWMSSASASAVSQYLAPYTTCGTAEFFMWARRSPCFVFYDDLSRHAVAYRELSLLLRRPPGREAFPGEIFFVHSRLLERSCKLHFGLGGGSITAFPVIETLAGDVSGYIVSNVISITDGQIFLATDLFLSSIRPAVDVGLSVTRVGSAAQTASMKQVGGAYKIELAQYFELQAFSQFASDIGAETQLRLARGVRLVALLTQSAGNPLSTRQQVRALCLANQGFYPRSCFVRSGTQELRGLRLVILTLPEWLSIGCALSAVTKSLQLA